MSKAEDDDGEELGRTVGAVLVDDKGALLASVTATDGEGFWTFLEAIPDIAAELSPDAVANENYAGSFSITGMDRAADGTLWLADGDGHVHTNASGKWKLEPVTPGKALRAIRCLADGTVAAAGTAGEVWVRAGVGSSRRPWQRLGEQLGGWINALDGRGRADLWAAGDAGLLARFDGAAWERTDVVANVSLAAVLVRGDEVLACGEGGALFRRTKGAWKDLTQRRDGLFGLANYRDEVWIACGEAGAGRLVSDRIKIVRDTFAAYEVHANGAFIAFAGNDLVVRHDGTAWEALSYEDDDDDDDDE